jgi:TonB-dependent starch-binding outer membrane protein SusC
MRVRGLLLLPVLSVAGAAPVWGQTRLLLGRAQDSLTAQALDNGRVVVLGTPLQAPINLDGTFVLRIPVREVTLEIRALQYRRTTIQVAADAQTVIVPVPRDYFLLEQVVVSGAATQVERRNLANAVSTLSADQLSRVPAQSIEQAFVAKIAGAMVQQNSGAPGGGMQVRLRGVTTILGNSTPLYVVDGVIVSDATIPAGTNAVTRGVPGSITSDQENSVNRIADLNPNDIERIEILKGASASVLYGSKASNGVILITTKRGRDLSAR